MVHAVALLMATALIPTMLMYGIGLLIVRGFRLSAGAQVFGFLAAWCGSTLIALFLAAEPNGASAQDAVIVASLIASVAALYAAAVVGKRHSGEARSKKSNTSVRSESRLCPFCAEEIRAAAVICRYCNRDVTPVDADGRGSSFAQPEPVLTDEELMKKYDISFDGQTFRYKEYRYSKLADAVSYADLQSKKKDT